MKRVHLPGKYDNKYYKVGEFGGYKYYKRDIFAQQIRWE